jgi:hypothetical protein
LQLSVDDVLDDHQRVADAIRVSGKGGKQRFVPVGSFARSAVESYVTRARPALLRGAKNPSPALFLRPSGRQVVTPKRLAHLGVCRASRRVGGACFSPHPEALVRDTCALGWRRYSGGSRATRTLVCLDNPDLHKGDHRYAARRLSTGSPPCPVIRRDRLSPWFPQHKK